MSYAFVSGVGLSGPGLPGWAASRAVLAGQRPYVESASSHPTGVRLPATERRRATAVTRLAVDVAAEALGAAEAGAIATVFASSGGEVEVIHAIFEELAGPERVLSPTRFHNSVHNAAAGYWSIATGSHAASDSLCGFDDSFGAGLAETLIRCETEGRSVLLVAYDAPPVFPLAEARPMIGPFGVSLLLHPVPVEGVWARIDGGFVPGADRLDTLADPGLERLRLGNPAAHSLPLLATLASGASRELRLGAGMGGCLRLKVEPWG